MRLETLVFCSWLLLNAVLQNRFRITQSLRGLVCSFPGKLYEAKSTILLLRSSRVTILFLKEAKHRSSSTNIQFKVLCAYGACFSDEPNAFPKFASRLAVLKRRDG